MKIPNSNLPGNIIWGYIKQKFLELKGRMEKIHDNSGQLKPLPTADRSRQEKKSMCWTLL